MRTVVRAVRQRIEIADDGQGTVEYVLVLLAAAAMASTLLIWIGKTSLIPAFFSSVLRFVTGTVG